MAVLSPRSCALPEGLRHYLLRDNVMVPMVPVDQLPFLLQGVPRQLDHRQMSEQRWRFVEETKEPASPLPILTPTAKFSSQPTPAVKSRFLAPDHYVRAEYASVHAEEPRPARSSLPSPLSVTDRASDLPRSINPAFVEHSSTLANSFASTHQKDTQHLGYRIPYPSGIEPDPSKKEYCTHWIKTGECAFLSIGCKYKHEMPTPEKLRELGFTQGLPKWWKEKSALGTRGLTWMQRRLAGSEDRELTDEVASLRVFSEPIKSRVRRDALRTFDESHERERGVCTRKVAREEAVGSHKMSVQDAASKTINDIQNLLIDIDETPAAATTTPSPQLSHSSLSSAETCDTEVSCGNVEIISPSTSIIEGDIFFKINGTEVPKADEVESPKATEDKLITIDEQASPKPNKNQPSRASIGLTNNNTHTTQPCIRRHSETSWASSSDQDLKPKTPISKRKSTVNKPSKQPGLAVSKHAGQNTNAEHGCTNTNPKLLQHKALDVPIHKLQAGITQLRRTDHQKERARRGAVSVERRARTRPAAIVQVTRMAA